MKVLAPSLPDPREASWSRRVASLLALAALCWALPSQAEKPEWAGGRKEPRAHAVAPQAGAQIELRIGGYFGEQQRRVVQQDHQRMIGAGHCPPGLAKKGQGCVPPGQAKKAYRLGQPLPAGVVYYDLPPTLIVRLGAPPVGHRFVRVAADILLIAVGTGMVIDAIEDLGR